MLTRNDAAFVLIDVQEKLARVMHNRDALIENLVKLVKGLRALGIPMVWCEQNPNGLGPTVAEVAASMAGEPIVKISFSCCGEQSFSDALKALGRRQVLVAGIETHVCVYQTVADLLNDGLDVEVVADCVASRTAENKAIGLEKMKQLGAKVTSVEMALFELLKAAEGPAFKDILKIVK